MRRLVLVLAVAWQVEMAVEAGIAASRKPSPFKSAPVKSVLVHPVPQCTGPSCPTPQQQPHPQATRIVPR